MSVIQNKNPKRLFEIFEDISALPRSSGHEEKIADYIQNFALARGLFCLRDRENNVFVRRDGKDKSRAPLLLQGHTDMVCVSTNAHDFEHDGLELFIDEKGLLGARGTTLGADDGVAVAIMLTLLEHECECDLECLFTTSEEIGLEGACAFDYTQIKSRRMINLDGECDGEALISCAGGKRIHAELPLKTESANGEAMTIRLRGFAGGHSGADIGKGRINALRALSKILVGLRSEDLRLISFDGGDKDNAIPIWATAKFIANTDFGAKIKLMFDSIKNIFTPADANAKIEISREEFSGSAAVCGQSAEVLLLIAKIKNAIVSMRSDMDDMVKTSLNFGVVRTKGDKIELDFALRSSDESELELLTDEIENELCKAGAKCTRHGIYPPWDSAADTPLKNEYREKYKSVFGRDVKLTAIHAGLECGIVKAALPDMDIISVGPTMYEVHTPQERLDLNSFASMYEVIRKMIL